MEFNDIAYTFPDMVYSIIVYLKLKPKPLKINVYNVNSKSSVRIRVNYTAGMVYIVQ